MTANNTCGAYLDMTNFIPGWELFYRNVKWWEEVLRPKQPQVFRSRHTVANETPLYRLLDFSTDHTGIPTIIFPPQAGGKSNIADYNPEGGASLVQTALREGRTHLFCVDYKEATPTTSQGRIDDLIRMTDEIIDFIGGRAEVIALCQGVWQATIHAALFPHKVHSLILGAGPINFDDPSNQVCQAVQSMGHDALTAWTGFVLGLTDGVWPGALQSAGFKMMDPVKKVYKVYSDMFWNVTDEKWMDRHRRFVDWFDTRQNMGAWPADAAVRLFLENQLVDGRLEIMGRVVDLSEISCPVAVLWSSKDDITSEKEAMGIAAFVPVTEITGMSCGHVGVFNSSKSLNYFWPIAFKAITTYYIEPMKSAKSAERIS